LSCSRTPVYAPRAKCPHSPFGKWGEKDLKALLVERPVPAGQDWEGKKVGFLNILSAY
jgi:hypothetical protein